ncbi:rhomboid family intramembrane serine protease [Peribacillus kribbensis]|uniref:rhomboid family intramembrane serine protease n=1 Tax=Peribacillus kribbensis TaxID=356658 RepID=UPI000685B5E0|nr:rhomboid family intramembrane serine protease [Peribacillus kribbensis]
MRNLGAYEELLYWSAARHLIEQERMTIIYIDPDQSEIWLESSTSANKVVRLALTSMTWCNLLVKDIEQTTVFGENTRKTLRKNSLNIVNVYFTPALPVDDCSDVMASPASFRSTIVESFILDTPSYGEKLPQLRESLGFELPEAPFPGDDNEVKAAYVRHAALSTAFQEIKKEQNVFEAGRPFFTYIFLFVQIGMFFLLEMNGGSQNFHTLIKYGAKYNPLIEDGEWWRLFLPMFLHIGLLHLLTNSLSLYYIGTAVERIYGNVRFILIYLFAGFLGFLASFVFNTSLSAGASGAIFGCFGALLYFGLLQPKIFFRTMGYNIILLVVINLGIGFTLAVVDNSGHIGGLIGGFLAAAIVRTPREAKKLTTQVPALAATAAIVWALISKGY